MVAFFAAIHFILLALIIGVVVGAVGLAFLLKKRPDIKIMLGL